MIVCLKKNLRYEYTYWGITCCLELWYRTSFQRFYIQLIINTYSLRCVDKKIGKHPNLWKLFGKSWMKYPRTETDIVSMIDDSTYFIHETHRHYHLSNLVNGPSISFPKYLRETQCVIIASCKSVFDYNYSRAGLAWRFPKFRSLHLKKYPLAMWECEPLLLLPWMFINIKKKLADTSFSCPVLYSIPTFLASYIPRPYVCRISPTSSILVTSVY